MRYLVILLFAVSCSTSTDQPEPMIKPPPSPKIAFVEASYKADTLHVNKVIKRGSGVGQVPGYIIIERSEPFDSKYIVIQRAPVLGGGTSWRFVGYHH